jgi:hypothetical protein
MGQSDLGMQITTVLNIGSFTRQTCACEDQLMSLTGWQVTSLHSCMLDAVAGALSVTVTAL